MAISPSQGVAVPSPLTRRLCGYDDLAHDALLLSPTSIALTEESPRDLAGQCSSVFVAYLYS